MIKDGSHLTQHTILPGIIQNRRWICDRLRAMLRDCKIIYAGSTGYSELRAPSTCTTSNVPGT